MKYLLASLIAAGLMGVVAPVVAANGVISYYPELHPSYYCLAEGQPDNPCYPTNYRRKTFDCPNTGSLPIGKHGGMGTPKQLSKSTVCVSYQCKKINDHNTTYFECHLVVPSNNDEPTFVVDV